MHTKNKTSMTINDILQSMPKLLKSTNIGHISDLKIENKDEKKELINNILHNEILDNFQKEELNKLIFQIRNADIKKIINDDKLDIVFDIDNTISFTFITNLEIYKELRIKYPEKAIKLISFNMNGKYIFSILILRKGLFEFLEFAKSFCNFYIYSLGVEPYVFQVMEMLEKLTGIKFKGFMTRKDKENNKLLKNLNLDSNKTIIFDDNPRIWPINSLNVIISKIFIDKTFIQYKHREIDDGNKLNNFLYNFFPFFYYKSKGDINNQIYWKNQKLNGGRICPFYYFNNNVKDNDCYSGEYIESSKYQFIYMKDIIKIIYYFIFNYNIHVHDVLKLIRYNIFYKTYFSLKFY